MVEVVEVICISRYRTIKNRAIREVMYAIIYARLVSHEVFG